MEKNKNDFDSFGWMIFNFIHFMVCSICLYPIESFVLDILFYFMLFVQIVKIFYRYLASYID